VERIRLATLDDVPPGSGLAVLTDVGLVAVFNVGGDIHAIDDLCPHVGDSLAGGPITGCIVTCPGHGWRFDVRSGASPDFEGIRVRRHQVSVENGVIYLHPGPGDLDLEWDDAADPDDIEDPLFD
jgi:nitrite reductase/ring-hydroxylating ferredoxin subunit